MTRRHLASEPLEFPLQRSLVGPLSQLPSEEARAAFIPVWAADQLIDKLAREARSILGVSA